MSPIFYSRGAQLAYREWGSGIPVVFLHPTPLDHDYWRPLIAELHDVRAIVPDLRGHGASQLGSGLPAGGFDLVPDAPVLSMIQLASDVWTLLDTLALRDAVFVGCSIGGYVLLELWRQAPKRIRGFAFICSKPQPDTPAARAKRVETIAKARHEGVQNIFESMAQSLLGATTRTQRPDVVAEIQARMTLTPDAVVAVLAGLASRPDSIPTVNTISVPVLAVAGGEDTSISPADMEVFEAAPGGCESHLLPDAGHFAAYEQPQKVASILADWMRQFA